MFNIRAPVLSKKTHCDLSGSEIKRYKRFFFDSKSRETSSLISLTFVKRDLLQDFLLGTFYILRLLLLLLLMLFLFNQTNV